MAGALLLTLVVMASAIIKVAEPCQPGMRLPQDPCTAINAQTPAPAIDVNAIDDPNRTQNLKWLEEQIARHEEQMEANMPEPNAPIAASDVAEPNSANDVNTAEHKKFAAVTPKKKEGLKPNITGAMAVHGLCGEFLGAYVDDAGMVDYKSLRRKRLDILKVTSKFASLDPNEYASWSPDDNLAFWINVYNVCTIKAVIDNYPIQASRFKMIFYPANSVMQISGMYDKIPFTIMGENYTLTEIEQKILRRQFNDPRVCVAINYASLGSAPLRREPYAGESLNKQLNDQAARFLATDSGLKIDRNAPAVYLSPVFEWYAQDFAAKFPIDKQFNDRDGAQAAILSFVMQHVPKKDADWLVRKMYPVSYMRFNWVLNEQR